MVERRILRDFHIGVVEAIQNEVNKIEEKENVSFSPNKNKKKRRSTFKREKMDWNALVRKNTRSSNPIGTSTNQEI